MARKILNSRYSTEAKGRDSFYGQFSTTDKKGREEREKTSKKRRETLQLLLLMVIAFDLVFAFVRPFVAEPMYAPSESMAPTLQVGDRVLTNKLAYYLSDPERGDLVVFEDTGKQKNEDTVKRVIGLPGDEISVEDGTLLVNRELLDEPYLSTRAGTTQESASLETFGPVFVPKDHVFVMGDNRANSYDSRFFGPVPNENLVGEVSLRFWPTDRLGVPS